MATLEIIQSVSLVLASLAAIWGINAWRREYIGKRRVDLAEEVLAKFYEAKDAIDAIRCPLSHLSEGSSITNPDGSPKNETTQYEITLERYRRYTELFSRLSSLRYRFMACFGTPAAEPFKDMHKVISGILAGARHYALLEKSAAKHPASAEREKRRREQFEKLEDVIWWAGDDDEIAKRVDKIVAAIEAQCAPIINKPSLQIRCAVCAHSVRRHLCTALACVRRWYNQEG